MVLKLQRRRDVPFQAYLVASNDFPLGGIWHLDHSPVELWGWSIWNIYVFGDGHGPCQGGAGSRDQAMEMFAHRWRIWLAFAGLSEIGPPSRAIDCTPTALTLRRLEDGPSESCRIESNGVPLGVIGRTYGIDTSRWYWSLSLVSTPVNARKMSYPCGGGDQVEALEGFVKRWRVWLATAGLAPEPAETKVLETYVYD